MRLFVVTLLYSLLLLDMAQICPKIHYKAETQTMTDTLSVYP
ncbi:MAG: hypothetical protein P8H45_03725 [Flavobacteriaceae bacterium]|nr:hypothetical protein [Flavobacteriaceae bacterium]